jgi:hypothetical protein
MIIPESQALSRIAELCEEIQEKYREIRTLSDRFDIAVELQIPVEDGLYPDVIDANYNWESSDWQSSSYSC